MSTTPYGGVVYVVEDDDGMADLYTRLFASVAIRAERFADGESFLAGLSDDAWGAVILDLRMPGMGGMEVLRRLRASERAISAIVVTGHGEIRSAVEAMQGGAVNFLQKPFSNEELLASAQRALAESRRLYAQRTRRGELQRRLAALSARERQIAGLVARGLTSSEIAAELAISVRTVEVHRSRALEHLECDNAVQVARLILEVQPPGRSE